MEWPTRSMEPTIRAGEIIEIDWNAYTSSNPSRWDVVVTDSPTKDPGQWVLRIVGLPGETVEIRDDGLYIDGNKESPPPRISSIRYSKPVAHPGVTPVLFPHRVAADSYFTLGDNASNSLDSRYWGDLKASKIQGRVIGK